MIKIENECVGCPQGCINCGKKHMPHFYCDECGGETMLYEYEGRQLCVDCLLDELKIVEGSDCY